MSALLLYFCERNKSNEFIYSLLLIKITLDICFHTHQGFIKAILNNRIYLTDIYLFSFMNSVTLFIALPPSISFSGALKY